MRVVAVRGSDFRCYERVAVELPAGLVGVVGPNGAGKTALIEMIHFGCLGYSPRTTSEAQVVRFGAELLRVETDVLAVAAGRSRWRSATGPGEPKRVTVDGAAERSVERLLGRFPVLVFTPDRLRLVQGAPALRRAYLDRVLARLWPALAAASGRVRAPRCRSATTCCGGCAPALPSAGALDPWDSAAGRGRRRS